MKERVFGFDVGTTSIGFAVIDDVPDLWLGHICGLGVRIFPEARDPKGIPLNQQRRAKRMMRRQLRRRRLRRRALNETLAAAGLLPAFDRNADSEWAAVMRGDPYALRARGLAEPLQAFELGRALYHLAKRRQFKTRDAADSEADGGDDEETATDRQSTLAALRRERTTLGAWLAGKDADARKGHPPTERRRGIHAERETIAREFEALWTRQAASHARLQDDSFKAAVREMIFFQRPVFWRTNTLGHCRFMPDEPLCPKGAWLSQQRRMLEKLNNLALAGGNQRPLDAEERDAIRARLQTQAFMSWAGVRSALKPLYAARGQKGLEKELRFNLDLGGDRGLPGNAVEAKLADIFGADWPAHPHKQAIRDAAQARLGGADYARTPDGARVVILSAAERLQRRAEAARSFVADFGVTSAQATALQDLAFPAGWEPFSAAALRLFLPRLEAGSRMGELLNGPGEEAWRDATFPDRERPSGEIHDLLPSPKQKEEQARIRGLRNPTVVRVQNELRKVVNNLIRVYGKPDRIRIELARTVGKSLRERDEDLARNRKHEAERRKARDDLEAQGIAEPSRDDIERWRLWKECGAIDPYSGQHICFDDLFRNNLFQVEHIWPRSKSLDDSFANKTLCHRDWNVRKNNRQPYEAFGHTEEWTAMTGRMWRNVLDKRMPKGKALRFCREAALPDDFASRQLNDTGYAARQAVEFLKLLWPDRGSEAPVTVQAVSGRVTARLRRLWQLNNILSPEGEKNRRDHRHHAVDALVVACTHPGMSQALSRFWQEKENAAVPRPSLPPPWPSIRGDADAAVAGIVVSHRVRKKVSGPLHEDTTYGDTGEDAETARGSFLVLVKRKKVEALSRRELDTIRDGKVREIVTQWVAAHGGDPKKAFATYPRLGEDGPEIRTARLTVKRQRKVVAPVATGYADLGANHHIAIYRMADGKTEFEVVSLYEAARRLQRHEPVVRRERGDGGSFVMSLAAGEAVKFPQDGSVWIVQGVWANGPIVLERANDAAHATTVRPNAASLLKQGAQKVSVDPIGRVRPAQD